MKRRIIGCGNALRKDDGVGIAVARRLKAWGFAAEVQEASGEGADLLERLRGAESVVVIDAMRSGRAAGTLSCFGPLNGEIETGSFAGTHGFGVAQAISMARALGAGPPDIRVYGIEGSDFSMGEELTPEVEAAAERLARLLMESECTAND